MKGISLATNTIVVIIIAVLVLAVVIYFVLRNSNDETIDYQALYEIACLKLLLNCNTDNLNRIEVASGGNSYTLDQICSKLEMNEITCKTNCGCSA